MLTETERLLLREMNDDDFQPLYELLADSEIMQHYPYTFDEARVRNWIQRNIDRYRIFGFGLLAVCLKETGEMIGDCGLTMQIINGQIKPEIGYHIRADKQRKGYAKEAAIAVRNWAFNNTPFNVVYSYMKYTNEASIKTAMSYGCKQVDELFDAINGITKVFAISRDDWINR
ncbi:MAG: GNAT family N-acetyltransferase [Clostridia bacterium]|nr:GNAT family N-acetyltransferase [Clostridia bacterium]